MMRLTIAAGLILAGAGGAMADACFVDPVLGYSYSPDDSAVSVTPDYFKAFINNPGTCDLNFAAHSNVANDPDLFEVYTGDVRGGFLVPGDEAEVTVEHNGRTSTGTLLDGPDPVTHYIGKEGDGTLRPDITVDLTVAGDPSSEVQIDSIDYNLVATMTRDEAEDSLVSIGLGQAGLVTHLGATAGLLTGGNAPLEGDNEFGVIGGVGSYMFGTTVRYNISDGFSLLGGLSIVDQSPGATSYSGILGAAALRYVQPEASDVRYFGEAGLQAAALTMSFTRTYTDSLDTQTVSGDGTGGLGSIYGRAGVIWAPDANNEVVFSASLRQSVLGIADYQEDQGADNLFAADLSGTSASFTTVKAGADWTTQLAEDVDLTASAALGTTVGNNGTAAYVFGGGDVVGAPQSTLFAEYGVRVGWDATPDARVDGFLQGSTGTGIGSHAQVGAAYHMKF